MKKQMERKEFKRDRCVCNQTGHLFISRTKVFILREYNFINEPVNLKTNVSLAEHGGTHR